MSVSLNEFIQTEVKTLMEFQKKWRKLNQDKPGVYPMELSSTFVWFKQYMAYCATKLEITSSVPQKDAA